MRKYSNFTNFIIIGWVLLFMSPALAYAQTASGSSGSAQDVSGGSALNWAGYVSDKGSSYTSVSGSWVIPTVSNISANGADATWVGIGGVLTHDLIQTGTEAVPDTNGGIDYLAWYELLPAGSHTVPLTVHAGDSMTATITQVSAQNGTWQITLTDTTTGKSYSTTVTYASSLSSADWIEEMPAGVGTRISLDDFGTVDFTNGSTVENGTSQTISGSAAVPLTMINVANQSLAVPSGIGSDAASFSVTRTDASSNSIGIGVNGLGDSRTFVSNGSNSNTGTTTAITPDVTVSYGYSTASGSVGNGGGQYAIRARYRRARSYSYSTTSGNGIIRVMILNGFSRF